MADATITATQVGAYSKALAAATVYTVDVVPANGIAYGVVQIINHGAAAVFVKSGTTVTVDDATADIIPAGAYIERQIEHKGATATVALISSTVGSVSVARSPRPHPAGASSSGGGGASSSVTLLAGTASVGTVGLNAGTNYVGQVRLTDGTNNPTVRPASTAALVTDTALVVQIHPASPIIVGAAGGSTLTSISATSTASTNLTAGSGAARTLFEISITNPTASPVYWKLYNLTSTSVTVGTTVPVLTIPVPATSTVVQGFGPNGKRLSTGLSWALTGAMAATDATAVGAGVVVHGTHA